MPHLSTHTRRVLALLAPCVLAALGRAQSDVPRDGDGLWAFRPPVAEAVPRLADDAWSREPLDAFVLQSLRAHALEPRAPADRRTLLRRVTYALTGLPPTPEETVAFCGDERPDAYERVVDRLLASPRYGVRWARAWLDVARFGESDGFEHDELRANAWPYRDWVVAAWNDDLPYDAFASAQLAGDALGMDVAATGFLVAGGYDRVGQEQQSAIGRALARQDELEDLIGTTAQAFLGLTAHCARCHDHPHDPIAQREYYQLAAAFAGVARGERAVAVGDDDAAERAHARAALALLEAELAALERPVRTRLANERGEAAAAPPSETPLWEWCFDRSDGAACGPPLELEGSARFTAAGLVLEEGAFARSAVLPHDVGAKTLEAVVRLADLDQRGGGVLSLESLDGARFDAIVFGEREPRRWLAGSDFFRRTRDVSGADETAAAERAVHVAVTWSADGRIAIYRDGLPYGTAYAAEPSAFAAGTSRLVFGLRHDPPSAGKLLRGTLLAAALHDRALDPEAIARRAAHATVTERELLAAFDREDRRRHHELSSAIRAHRALLARPTTQKVFAVLPRAPQETFVLRRGDPQAPLDPVTPRGLAALEGVESQFALAEDADEGARRVALARWITAPENPLFRRVIVNRLWAWHFGAGLVDTPSDFGTHGARPSHPALLDHLALELRRDGDSLKGLQRRLVQAAAFRQASTLDPAAATRDRDARRLWRFPPRRLEAEMVWDTLHAVSGALDERFGGPGDRDFQAGVRGSTQTYEPLDDLGEGPRRRALFRVWARGGRNPLLDAFDCPDPSTTAPRRRTTTTPLQALSLLNHPHVVRLLDGLARAVEANTPDPDARVDALFALLYQREPDAAERARLGPFLRAHGTAALARALANTHEFLHVD